MSGSRGDPGVPEPARVVGSADGDRRVLLISYHFPPDLSAGALRWQKLAHHLHRHGWEMDVVSRRADEVPHRDDSLVEALPAGTCIYGIPSRVHPLDRFEGAVRALLSRLRPRRTRPSSAGGGGRGGGGGAGRPRTLRHDEIGFAPWRLRDLRRAHNAWLAIARDRLWGRDAARLACRLARVVPYELVISCGPPHGAHLAGVAASRVARAPLVCDLRDPWALPRRQPEDSASPLWFHLARRLEARVVGEAALVVTNTETVRDAMARVHGSGTTPIVTITNGHDDEPVPAAARGRFVVTYAGGIYLDRDPRPLMRACRRAIDRLGVGPDAFGLEFIGNVADYEGTPTTELARREGLEAYVTLRSTVPRRVLMEHLARASVLVSLPQDTPYAIPSKIFEYMSFPSWLLVFSDPGSATWSLLEGSPAGLVRRDEIDATADLLEGWFRAHAAGTPPERLSDIPEYRRDFQARRLLEHLDTLAPGAASGAPAC